MCLLGNSAADVLKEVGIKAATSLSYKLIAKIPTALITKINQMVGMRLITKAGSTGVINLVKWVPIVGGIVGGAVDGYTTNIVSEVAVKIFQLRNDDETEEGPVLEGEIVS